MQPTTAAAECPGRTCGRGWQPKSQAQPTTTSEAQHRLMQRAAFEQELEKYPKLRSDKFDAFIESWERSVSPPRSPAAAPALAARTAAPQADLDFWKQLREVLVQAAGSNAAKVQAEFEKVS